MSYCIECRIICDEKVIEKIRAITKQWNSLRLVIHNIQDLGESHTPNHWRIDGVFEESEKYKIYSLPFLIEGLGGFAWITSIIKTRNAT